MSEIRVPLPAPCESRSRFVTVDGIRTHYLEAGEGPPLVLLHSGEYGGCGELSWEYMIPKLSQHFRVIAPDWLGFGKTDKIHDFDSKRGRMLSHMVRFVETLALDRAHFAGNSMGGTFLLEFAGQDCCPLPIDKIVAISGGGFTPDNEHRRSLLDYDCTEAAMKKLLAAIFEDSVWFEDEEYVRRRYELSILPGVWESVAATRFKRPNAPQRSDFGNPDKIAYEKIMAPTLVIAGAHDKVRLPNYTDEFVHRIPNAKAVVLQDAGHCPNIERADRVTELMIEFLS